jgi:hypothetical protein
MTEAARSAITLWLERLHAGEPEPSSVSCRSSTTTCGRCRVASSVASRRSIDEVLAVDRLLTRLNDLDERAARVVAVPACTIGPHLTAAI